MVFSISFDKWSNALLQLYFLKLDYCPRYAGTALAIDTASSADLISQLGGANKRDPGHKSNPVFRKHVWQS
jgi:hypothetical protein